MSSVNDIDVMEAAKVYAEKGIITFPVHPPTADVKSPGKQPKHKDWQKATNPYIEEEINRIFAEECNIGLLCGRKSDTLVIDTDLFIKGIWDNILMGIDKSQWIRQAHAPQKWHYIFKYCQDIKAGQYQALGFDILSDDLKKDSKGFEYIAGDNCICAPSVHPDGNKYQITGDIAERPAIPVSVVKRINNILDLYNHIKNKVLPKCRPAFRGLWGALFENKRHELYRNTSIFFGSGDSRDRCLNLFTELKANGAEYNHLLLVSMLIFGDRFDSNLTEKELNGIDSGKTATNKTLSEDPYFSQFHMKGKEAPDTQKPKDEDQRDPLDSYSEEVKEAAYKLLKYGDPFNYFMEACHRRHVGDDNLAETCLCSVGATMIVNSRMGIHIKPSGKSGKGKSSTMITVIDLLPDSKHLTGSMSSKALFYNPNLKTGTIIFCDDVKLSEELQAVIKQSTSDFQKPTLHGTVNNGKYEEYQIAARIAYWLTSVDGFDGDDGGQIANRFFNGTVNESEEQDAATHKFFNECELHRYTPDDFDAQVCKCIIDILSKDVYEIVVPFAAHIIWRNQDNRRNYPKFLDMIRAVALFRVFQLDYITGDEHNIYLAGFEDFERASRIYAGTAQYNATNLTKQESDVLRYIESMDRPVSVKDIMRRFDLSQSRVQHLIKGKDGKGGMLSKVAGFEVAEIVNREYFYEYDGEVDQFINGKVAELSVLPENEHVIITEFKNRYFSTLLPSITELLPDKVIDKTITVDNNNLSITSITDNIEMGNNKTYSRSKSQYDNSCDELPSSRVQGGNSGNSGNRKPTDDENRGNRSGNSNVIDGQITDLDEKEEDRIKNIKDLPQMRKDLETFRSTYLKNNGGIESIEVFVGAFLNDCHGYCQLFKRQAIIFEAQKICKTTASI